MKKNASKKNYVGGIHVNKIAFPLLLVVAILHIIIIYLILDVNRSGAELSDMMEQSGRYQIDATRIQGSNTVFLETCNNYIQMPVARDGTPSVESLKAYADQLKSDDTADKVLERFETYDVSDEVFSYVKNAAEISEQMMEIQFHAISLMKSVYSMPSMPELSVIPEVPLTQEERALSPSERVIAARRMILDKEYAAMRYKITENIDNCNQTLRREFIAASEEAERHVAIVRLLLWLAVFVIIIVLSFTFIMFYRLIVIPVRSYSDAIDDNQIIEKVKSIYELRRLVNAFNNLWNRRNKLESILRSEAETDALTGLPNRFSMERDLIENETYSESLGVLMFDINFLKHTNDTKGHLAGDQLIRTAASCIKECFADETEDNCYRIGGDEFVVFLKGCSEEGIHSRIEKFDSVLQRENISVSVGYAYEERSEAGSFKNLMGKADRRMYDNKKLAHEKYSDVLDGMIPDEYNAENEKIEKYDYLTGLPSVTYFFELAEGEKKAITAGGGHPALMYFDLIGMKYYNHKYGFAEGDNMLRSFSKLLRSTFKKENCCHIGADHFAAISDENGLEDTLNILFREWQERNMNKHLPISVGIYPNWAETVSIGIAYDRSKIACDALKGTYYSSFNYFSSELDEGFSRHQYILDNFENALSGKWIRIYYQPIMRAINRKICDEEALARWIDPDKGVLAPTEFIPYLEEAGLIYKLDLYVLEQILEDMKTQEAENLYVVPHSLNLSRSDFDSCDIVEEIRKRVDASGVSREKINIEITESIIGSDFDFMKKQIERFQDLGFQVWMDDFGSGYSSLDVLQSIKFDLIKFDMNFMRRLDENDDGRIILTELMKMASSLGVDTICEGVETEEQARFLQEIGCSKLQGFYYSQPIPFEESLKWHKNHKADGYENPDESSYYESICGVNLFDLGVIAREAEDSLQNTYSTLPMGIIEVKGDRTRFLRSNQSYRDFLKRFFGLDLSKLGPEFVTYDAAFMYNVVKTCCEQDIRSFYDERMPDGSVVHSFARRISINPVTGDIAVAVAVLSISEPDEGTTYVDIARALAADYYCMYVVDLETDKYIEYSSPVGGQAMAMEEHGEDFFESSRQNADRVYVEDRETFYGIFNKEHIVEVLDEQGVFTATYRLVDAGEPVWVNMKLTRLQPSRNKIILGVSVIDSQMKQKEHMEELQKERATMVRVMALSDGYLSLYTVDPETGHYIEFTSSDDYAALGAPKEGDEFFRQLIDNASYYLYPEDQITFPKLFSEEKVRDSIMKQGYFSICYRIMIQGEPKPVIMRIAPFVDSEKTKYLVGVRTWKERKG